MIAKKKRLSKVPAIFLLLISLTVSACGGGSSSSGSIAPPPDATPPPPPPTSDTTAPSIVGRSPQDQETGVSTTATLIVTFDEALDQTTVDGQSLTVTDQAVPVPGDVTYDTNSNSLNFAPNAALSAETVYGVTVAGTVRDAAGNAFLGESWFFTTGGPFNLGGTSQATIDECMDDGDKRMLTLVNNARSASRSCGTQDVGPVATLTWNCRLDLAAQGHSNSMAQNDFHEHVSPVDGSDPGDRIRAAGYNPQTWGENIAGGFTDEAAAMDGWLTSPGHCSNIMNSAYSQMGSGFAENPASAFRIYWTQNFGRPQN